MVISEGTMTKRQRVVLYTAFIISLAVGVVEVATAADWGVMWPLMIGFTIGSVSELIMKDPAD